jgi:molecular chaperone DnaJ
LLVTVEVWVPDSLPEKAKQALRDYARAAGEVNPRLSLLGGA